ncbi:sugar ABC transporter permease [Leptolyngbya sp. 15MV]|nr:sugar ABC transporter permease [Leptolyngbya sp. 15MV]
MSDAAISLPRARPWNAEALAGWLLCLPSILAGVLFLLLPTGAVLVLAFTDYEMGLPSFNWVGFANFEELWADRGFARSVRNTAWYVLFVAPLSIAGGVLLALLIEAGMRGRATFRAIFFLPVVSLMVAMATAWQYLLHPTIGPINNLLRAIGVAGPNWLGSSDWVLVSLGLIGVWENLGFNMVLVLAGLTAIPRELYAAAEMDGARSALARFRLVTWPMLGPTMLFVVIITMIRSIRTFDSVATLTQGGPNKASELIVWTIYQEGFSFLRMGYSAAVTAVFLVVVLALMLVQTRVIERRVHYG